MCHGPSWDMQKGLYNGKVYGHRELLPMSLLKGGLERVQYVSVVEALKAGTTRSHGTGDVSGVSTVRLTSAGHLRADIRLSLLTAQSGLSSEFGQALHNV